MENFEGVSDCSEYSRNSEGPESITSTMSGLSEYKVEFLELEQSIHPEKFPNVAAKKDEKQNSCKTNTEITFLKEKISSLEKFVQHISTQNSSLSTELQLKRDVENEYKNVKMELSESQLELSAKTNCISELKAKISEQHIEVQGVIQHNLKLAHSMNSVSSDLEYVKKCANWYKDELHQLQKEKVSLIEENLTNIKNMALQEENIEQLKLELNKWKCSYDTVHLNSLKEKENSWKQMEIIKGEILENQSKDCVSNKDIEGITNYYETTIKDLTCDIARIKLDFENEQEKFKSMFRENTDLSKKCLIFQNEVKIKENLVENLEFVKKDLKMKLSTLLERDRKQNDELLEMRRNYSQMEIELNVKRQEKDDVEKSVKLIKEQFETFKNSYANIKDELCKKDKEITQLQFDKQELHVKDLQLTRYKDNLKSKLNKLKNGAFVKIETLKEKCKLLENKSAEITSLLNLVNKNESDDVKQLRAMLQVKVLEQEDHHKRYERSYRTLLRKLKEHMRGRNEAEKHNLYLKELHENLSDDHKTLRLQISVKDSEIHKLQASTDYYLKETEKFKVTISKLETELKDSEHCDRCIEFDILKNNLKQLEEYVKTVKNVGDVSEREAVSTLKDENQQLVLKVEVLEESNSQLCAKLNNLENAFSQETFKIQNLTTELITTKEEEDQLGEMIENLTQRNQYLSEDIENVRSSLRQQIEELEELRQHDKINLENLVSVLKGQAREIETIKKDKFFAERLCNDLSAALKVQVNNNKALKECVRNLHKERELYVSLPIKLANFTVPTKCNVDELLQETKTLFEDESFGDVRNCLDNLRKEITLLQRQIIEKN